MNPVRHATTETDKTKVETKDKGANNVPTMVKTAKMVKRGPTSPVTMKLEERKNASVEVVAEAGTAIETKKGTQRGIKAAKVHRKIKTNGTIAASPIGKRGKKKRRLKMIANGPLPYLKKTKARKDSSSKVTGMKSAGTKIMVEAEADPIKNKVLKRRADWPAFFI